MAAQSLARAAGSISTLSYSFRASPAAGSASESTAKPSVYNMEQVLEENEDLFEESDEDDVALYPDDDGAGSNASTSMVSKRVFV